MPVVVKNNYDVRRLIGGCGRCANAAESGSAHCESCREKNRQRFAAQRTLHRAAYNARMRAWKAKQRSAVC